MLVSSLFYTPLATKFDTDSDNKQSKKIKKIIPDNSFIEKINQQQNKLLSMACYLETHSEHMIAKAIVNFGMQYSLTHDLNKTDDLDNIKIISGAGIEAMHKGQKMAVGSLLWISKLAALSLQLTAEFDNIMRDYYLSGSTVVYAWLESEGIFAFVIEDQLRDNAIDIVQQMQENDFHLTLLSGDKKEVAHYMADKLQIKDVIAEVLPDEKDQLIQEKQSRGNLIAMVGDGINDAPALVRADVGIAMGSGTDVSIDSADVILVNGELEKIPFAAQLSQATLKTIKQNIGISIVYNVVMVPLAMAAMITPLVAAISMPISSLLVIANAARLRWTFKPTKHS